MTSVPEPRLPIMQSYTPQAEDVLLRRIFFNRQENFFVDVGAGDPIDKSVTWYFYKELGWIGINIEPNKAVYDKLCTARPRDININAAIDSAKDSLSIRLYDGNFNRSTASEALKRQYGDVFGPYIDSTVKAMTLESVLEQHATDRQIAFLKIDVEGWEQEVLRSLDIKKWLPTVIVVEATEPGRPTPNFSQWESLVLEAGYKRALFDGVNCWYARDPEVISELSVPVNVFDHYDPYVWPRT